mmetsp:Transcript_7295/g.23000  ORF Transcript_7295/g.23000 Transcript_7295/m.23000 type:complete len:279 (+) Transcript_7295:378-1214(+)
MVIVGRARARGAARGEDKQRGQRAALDAVLAPPVVCQLGRVRPAKLKGCAVRERVRRELRALRARAVGVGRVDEGESKVHVRALAQPVKVGRRDAHHRRPLTRVGPREQRVGERARVGSGRRLKGVEPLAVKDADKGCRRRRRAATAAATTPNREQLGRRGGRADRRKRERVVPLVGERGERGREARVGEGGGGSGEDEGAAKRAEPRAQLGHAAERTCRRRGHPRGVLGKAEYALLALVRARAAAVHVLNGRVSADIEALGERFVHRDVHRAEAQPA